MGKLIWTTLWILVYINSNRLERPPFFLCRIRALFQAILRGLTMCRNGI